MPKLYKCKISNFLGKSVFFHNVGTGFVTLTNINIVQWIAAKQIQTMGIILKIMDILYSDS